MPYQAISIHIAGKESKEKLDEIRAEAKKRDLSVSRYLVECHEIMKAAREKKQGGVQ